MSQAFQVIAIKDIPTDIKVEGYYWYSNAKKPEVITHETIRHDWFTELPFVIEANFYSRENQFSIQIRYVDGQYHVARIGLNQVEESMIEKQTYLGHDLDGRYFQVAEAWKPEPDPFCEDMDVLVPAWTAFAGFTNR